VKRFLLGAVIGAVVTIGVQTTLVGGSVAPPSGAASSPTPTPTVPPAVALQLDAAQRALAQAKISGKAVPVTITLTEQQFTAAAAAYFPLAYVATLLDPVVHLRPGQIVLDCAATLAMMRTTATILATPLVSDGKPTVRIDSAMIGDKALPDAAREALASNMLSAIVANIPAKFVVSSIVVGQATMTVLGTANP